MNRLRVRLLLLAPRYKDGESGVPWKDAVPSATLGYLTKYFTLLPELAYGPGLEPGVSEFKSPVGYQFRGIVQQVEQQTLIL